MSVSDSDVGGGKSTVCSSVEDIVTDPMVQCKLCKSRSDEPSPLKSQPGKARPWCKYSKIHVDGVTQKRPSGKVCMLCQNTFNALGAPGICMHAQRRTALTHPLARAMGAQRCTHPSPPTCHCGVRGLSYKHSSIGDYYKHISSPQGSSEHPSFLAALKEWIRQHNKDPERIKLQSKALLMEVKTVLDVEKRVGGRFKKPKKDTLANVCGHGLCCLCCVRCGSGVGRCTLAHVSRSSSWRRHGM